MRIRSIPHKGLSRFVERNDPKGLPPDHVKRARNILTAPIAAEDMDAVQGPPGWRIHQLAGDRARAWSIRVAGNWRITFVVESGEICNLDLEDCH